MATRPEPHPIVRIFSALEAEKIRFMLIGMSAARIQGVLASTIDVDIWIDLPPRQYMRVISLSLRAGATFGRNTVVYLEDGTPLNFVYEVTGLRSFAEEYPRAKWYDFHQHRIAVLPLTRIYRSKAEIGRDKDKLHMVLIRQFLRASRCAETRKVRRHAAKSPRTAGRSRS